MSDDRIIDVSTVPVKQVIVRDRRYEVIVMKEFKSTIPAHLLANLPEDERFMVETMSKLENQYAWLAEGVVKTNGVVLDLDERLARMESGQVQCAQRLGAMEGQTDKVNKLWDWKQFFSGKWAVLAAIAIVVIPLLLKFLLDLVVRWLKP